jgi:hypothetical protein
MPTRSKRRLDALLALGRFHRGGGSSTFSNREVADQVEALKMNPIRGCARGRARGGSSATGRLFSSTVLR